MGDESAENEGGCCVSFGIILIKIIIYIYDVITFPIYFLLQTPWIKTKAMVRNRANLVKKDDTSVIYKPIERTNKRLENFRKDGIKTMNDCFNYSVKQHGNKNLVGTRKILGKSEELQSNGKIFEKWEMGEYKWKTYIEVEEMSKNFGKGLRELGLHPMERICIFAETNADWMVCALSCFKQTFPLVTIYANLGDDAIVHVINETEVTHLITSHDLLPKFRSVLQRTSSIKVGHG